VKPINERTKFPNIPDPVAGARHGPSWVTFAINDVAIEGETVGPTGLDAKQPESKMLHQILDKSMSQQMELTRAVGGLTNPNQASIAHHLREWLEVSIVRAGLDGFQRVDE
jgi:hypothetical protein